MERCPYCNAELPPVAYFCPICGTKLSEQPASAAEPVLDPATGLPRLGNSGRNVIVGPGLNIMDAGIYKRFRMGGEKRVLTFRVELFNALNHPNWANPDINVSNE